MDVTNDLVPHSLENDLSGFELTIAEAGLRIQRTSGSDGKVRDRTVD